MVMAACKFAKQSFWKHRWGRWVLDQPTVRLWPGLTWATLGSSSTLAPATPKRRLVLAPGCGLAGPARASPSYRPLRFLALAGLLLPGNLEPGPPFLGSGSCDPLTGVPNLVCFFIIVLLPESYRKPNHTTARVAAKDRSFGEAGPSASGAGPGPAEN